MESEKLGERKKKNGGLSFDLVLLGVGNQWAQPVTKLISVLVVERRPEAAFTPNETTTSRVAGLHSQSGDNS